jgi:hypothetical protein
MNKPRRATGAKHGKAKRTQGQLPIFIYLSDVIRQYGSHRIPATSIFGGSPDDGEIQAQVSFGSFLAEKIASARIPLFDVHSLKLVFHSDLDEVLHYLRSTSDQEGTSSLGFELGRDYCIDAERLSAEINSIESLPCINWQKVEDKSVALPEHFIPKTPPVSSFLQLPNRFNGWDGEDPEKEPLSQEFLRCRLGEGRFEAITKYKYPYWAGPRAKWVGPSLPPFSPGAIAALYNRDDSERIYLFGKFNKRGDPALWLDWVVPEPPDSPNTKKKGRTAERNATWQLRLDEMFKSGPHKGKSHTSLCKELAKILEFEKPLSSNVKFDSVRIRSVTRDPGHRPKGRQRQIT